MELSVFQKRHGDIWPWKFVLNSYILKIAGRTQIFVRFVIRSFIGRLLIIFLHSLYLHPFCIIHFRLYWSASLDLYLWLFIFSFYLHGYVTFVVLSLWKSFLFFYLFPICFLYVVFSPLSEWDPPASTLVGWLLSLYCSTLLLLKPSFIPLSMLWIVFDVVKDSGSFSRKKTMKKKEFKLSQKKLVLKESQFLSNKDLALDERQAQQSR